MIILVMELHIKAERREAFVAMIRDVAKLSEDEPGCSRFDVVQDEADPNHFFFYDIYRDKASAEAHKDTPQFRRYVDETRDIHAKPPVVTWCGPIYPDAARWR